MASRARNCDVCGHRRAWHKGGNATCGGCQEIERHTPAVGEPWTAGYVRRGLIHYPIKEHA